MSWEGYSQCICANGHYFQGGGKVHAEPEEFLCPDCNAAAAWMNMVDETNGDAFGEIPDHILRDQFMIDPGNSKSETRYRIPTKKETDPLRHFRPWDGKVLVPLAKK